MIRYLCLVLAYACLVAALASFADRLSEQVLRQLAVLSCGSGLGLLACLILSSSDDMPRPPSHAEESAP